MFFCKQKALRFIIHEVFKSTLTLKHLKVLLHEIHLELPKDILTKFLTIFLEKKIPGVKQT